MRKEQEKPRSPAQSPQSILPISKPPLGREVQFAHPRERGGRHENSHHGINSGTCLRHRQGGSSWGLSRGMPGVTKDSRIQQKCLLKGREGSKTKHYTRTDDIAVNSGFPIIKCAGRGATKQQHWNKAECFPPSQRRGSLQWLCKESGTAIERSQTTPTTNAGIPEVNSCPRRW
jgi:hypothetical protein